MHVPPLSSSVTASSVTPAQTSVTPRDNGAPGNQKKREMAGLAEHTDQDEETAQHIDAYRPAHLDAPERETHRTFTSFMEER